MTVFDVDPAWDLLDGTVDMHVHTAPDLIDRYETDLKLARDIRDAEMGGAVVKSHVLPTVVRTATVNEAIGDDILYGGIALNGSVGGLNPDAVEVALRLGAEIVWLPTAWSANHASQARAVGEDQFVGQRVPGPDEELSILSDDELVPEVKRIIRLVGESDAVLGTGHVSPDAIEAVVRACADAGTTCLVNHPFFRVVDLPVETQVRLAEQGAILEYCAYAVESTDGHDVQRVARAIDRVGPEHAVLATDFGQTSNPPVDGFARYAGALREAGLSATAVRTAMAETPRRLLGA